MGPTPSSFYYIQLHKVCVKLQVPIMIIEVLSSFTAHFPYTTFYPLVGTKDLQNRLAVRVSGFPMTRESFVSESDSYVEDGPHRFGS